MSKVLIVDDTDPAIVYSGSWVAGATVAQGTNEYNGTVHQSSTSGNTISYTFYGTGISVYGTVDSPSLHGPPNATFAVDSAAPVQFNTSSPVTIENPSGVTSHTLLYQSPGLPRATHTLSIKTGTPSSGNPAARLYIDYFTISTGSDNASGDIIVDDRDTSIVYTGSWPAAGAASEYLHTTRQSPDSANGGTAALRFNGTSITVYGTTPITAGPDTVASIDFLVDGVHSSTFTGLQSAAILRHTQLFHVKGLSNNREHTVTMNTLTSNWWYLDYMVYTTQNSALAGGGGGSQDTGGGTSPNVGAIVGGVIGGVVVLIGLLALVFIRLRRRRDQSELANPRPATGLVPGSHVTPFNSYNNGTGPPTTHVPTGSSAPFLSSSGSYGDSSAYTGYSGGQPAGSQPISAAQGISYVPHPHNNPLYPQFDAGAGRGVTSDTHSASSHENRNTREPAMVQSHSEKSRFGHVHNRSNSSNTTAVRRPSSPSPSSAIVELDSGIRIPTLIPPVYTAD